MTVATAHIPGTRDSTEAAAVGRLLAAFRLRDPGLADHGVRTAHIAAAIAGEMGMTTTDSDVIYLGGLLHDIGKLAVPEAVLWKPAMLDRIEWTEIRNHPEAGHRLVADLVAGDAAACVLYHHERIDAAGYPHGIGLATLHIGVRVVQVADAYDAMTSTRPYHGPLPVPAAMTELQRCAGTQFDAEVVGALDRIVAAGGVPGATVALSPDVVTLPADPWRAAAG